MYCQREYKKYCVVQVKESAAAEKEVTNTKNTFHTQNERTFSILHNLALH